MQITEYRDQKNREVAKNIPGLSILMELAEHKPASHLNDPLKRIVLCLARTSIARKGLTDRKILSAAYRMAVYKTTGFGSQKIISQPLIIRIESSLDSLNGCLFAIVTQPSFLMS